MKQKKRIWWTFNLWEADAFQQYLEEMALQGWFLENVGGSVMKFYRAQPEKRRYAALLVPGSSSLTGADSWKAEQFRKECQEAGWDFQCSGTYWQIFYTTDESVKLTGDMTEERQFLIQKSLFWNGSAKISYPVLVVLSLWSLYSNLQNPGKMQQSRTRALSAARSSETRKMQTAHKGRSGKIQLFPVSYSKQ